MRRLMFVRLEDTQFGGAENYLRRLLVALRKEAIQYELKHGNAPKFLASWLKALWLSWQIRLNKKPNTLIFSLARIATPDIYRAGDGVHSCFLRAMGKEQSKNPLHWVYRKLEYKAVTHAKAIIANSQMIAAELANEYHCADKIHVIPNGIDLNAVPAGMNKAELAQQHNFDATLPVVITVGSGFKRKGVDQFLEIIAQLKQPVTAVVLGKDNDMKGYKQQAQQLGIEKQVRFLGQVSNITDWYHIADVMLFLPRYEPAANVVLEAMLYGTAVISNRSNGSSELLSNEYVIESTDEALEKLEILISDSDLLHQVQDANVAQIQNYSIENNVSKTLALIQQVSLELGT